MLTLISFLVNVLSVLVLLVTVLYYFMKSRHKYWERRGVRSVPGHWFFGNFEDAILMRKPAGVVLGQLHQQGTEKDDVLGIYIFHKPFLLLRNPEVIKQILVKDFHLFSDRYFTGQSTKDIVGSSSLFSIRNPQWKYLRTKMTPVFTSGKLKNLFNLMIENGIALGEHLDTYFTDGQKRKEIFAKDVLKKYTNDVISSVAFGIRQNSFSNPPPEFYQRVQKGTKLTLIRGIRFFAMFFFPSVGKHVGGEILGTETDYFRKVFWNSMDTREATKSKRGDIIDSLIQLKNDKQDNEFKFEGDALLAQSTIFFIAGRESTVTTMTYALCELAKHPEIQKRAREEIIEKLNTHGMTYEAVQEMKYLFQVISETLRLYPPAPLLDRTASVDYKIPGTDITIEKGTPVYVSLYGIHYDPENHPEPMRFDPDRFSDERKGEMRQCSYLPFGEGPKSCIGMRLGLLQSAVGVISVLRNYEVALHPDYNCTVDTRNVFITPPDEFKMIFTKLS